MPSVVIFADLDSQVFGSLPFAQAFRSAGWDVVFDVPDRDLVPADLLLRLEADFPVVSEPINTLAFSNLTERADAIGVFTTGSKKARFRSDIAALYALNGRRPFVFAGYNGVVYERYEEGMFWRLGYDAICLNGPRDEMIFRAAVAGSPFEAQPIAITGINKPKLERFPTERPLAVFAEQVVVPAEATERQWLFSRIAELALRNADWDVAIKPRIRPNERTFHKTVLHPEDMQDGWPENLSISYQPLPELLSSASLLLTVSSTSFFDAIAASVPACVIGDFGVKISHGSHYFANSGVVTYLSAPEKLEAMAKRKPAPKWLRSTGATDEHSPKVLIDIIRGWKPEPLPPAMHLRQLSAFRAPQPDNKPPAKFDTLMSRGNAALANRHYPEALKAFTGAFERNKKSTMALRGIADAHLGMGNKDKARQTLLQAQKLQPQNKNIAQRLRDVGVKQGFFSRLGIKW